MIETLKSTEVLAKEGFKVMVYCNDDPLMAKRLENSGANAIMPLAAPIGSGLGIQNTTNIKIIRESNKVTPNHRCRIRSGIRCNNCNGTRLRRRFS
jgi:thiazole synthase